MGYTLTLEAPSQEKAMECIAALNYFCWLHKKDTQQIQTISTNASEHGYAPKTIKNGVFVSYSSNVNSVVVNFLFQSFKHLSINWNTRVFHDDEDITKELQHAEMKWRFKRPENLPKFLFLDRVKRDNSFKNFFDEYIKYL